MQLGITIQHKLQHKFNFIHQYANNEITDSDDNARAIHLVFVSVSF